MALVSSHETICKCPDRRGRCRTPEISDRLDLLWPSARLSARPVPTRAELEGKCTWKSVERELAIVHQQDVSSDIYFLVAERTWQRHQAVTLLLQEAAVAQNLSLTDRVYAISTLAVDPCNRCNAPFA